MGAGRGAVVLPVEPCPKPSDPLSRSWETVLQRVTDAVLVMDRDRNLRFVNHRARQLLGYEPGETLAGVVEHVYPELSPETRTVRARIVLERPHPAIRANMLANVTLLGEPGAAVVTIPRNALIRSGTEDRVVVALGEGRFAPRRVTAGEESGERIAIRDGLAAGEQVVVAGQFLLDSEANLRSGLGRLGHEGQEAAPERSP